VHRYRGIPTLFKEIACVQSTLETKGHPSCTSITKDKFALAKIHQHTAGEQTGMKQHDLTYAIPDLHGRIDLLERALGAIGNHAMAAHCAKPTIVTLGDYVDRGPDSKKVIERLMEIEGDTDTGRVVCLKGNHEHIMWLSCRRLPDCIWWMRNGGNHTLLSYGATKDGPIDLGIIPAAHLDWIDSLKPIYRDKYRIYVHAGLDAMRPLDQHTIDDVLWKIYDEVDEGGYDGLHVVHGHHAFDDGPILKKHRTDLDTKAYKTGHLAIGVFDDDEPGGPVEILHVEGEPA
jgi:serine/threonine protein phosphatase 1